MKYHNQIGLIGAIFYRPKGRFVSMIPVVDDFLMRQMATRLIEDLRKEACEGEITDNTAQAVYIHYALAESLLDTVPYNTATMEQRGRACALAIVINQGGHPYFVCEGTHFEDTDESEHRLTRCVIANSVEEAEQKITTYFDALHNLLSDMPQTRPRRIAEAE